MYDLSIIGTGFIAKGLMEVLIDNFQYNVKYVLTRSDIEKRDDFKYSSYLTNNLEDLISASDLIIECTGDVIYATENIDKILQANIPVVTMNSEFHVTTGSYFVDKGILTEAEGDQPGTLAALYEDVKRMGFKIEVLGNIKGFLNLNPTKDEMRYWANRLNISLDMVTSFTDGTKLQIEQTLVANGLVATIIQDELVGAQKHTLIDGSLELIKKNKTNNLVSDYILSNKLNPGVFVAVNIDKKHKNAMRHFKLGEGPCYVLERPYHLCYFEILKTIERILEGGKVLLNNSKIPTISVATVAKRDLKVGTKIKKGIGSFDVRGIAVTIANDLTHLPIGLMQNVLLTKDIKKGERIKFEDVLLPDSLAVNIWKDFISQFITIKN